jgi:hypothetical protein
MKAIQELKELVLVDGTDYGVIPGTDKPTLYKPGAEKICAFFGYVPEISVVAEIEDWRGERFGEPLFYYRYRVSLLKDGAAVGQGEGSANTWESKYRWRNASRKCPSCGKENIRPSKQDGGWYCWAKTGGCGATFSKGDRSIEGQEVGRVANPDFADVINTVQKMGQKRAYIAATLSATGASQWFTQDLEDMGDAAVEQIRREAGKVDTGGAPVGTRQAAANVAERKLAAAKATPAKAAETGKLPMNFTAIMTAFGDQKVRIGDLRYYAILRDVGGEKCNHANQLGDLKKFQAAYDLMLAAPSAVADEAVPA